MDKDKSPDISVGDIYIELPTGDKYKVVRCNPDDTYATLDCVSGLPTCLMFNTVVVDKKKLCPPRWRKENPVKKAISEMDFNYYIVETPFGKERIKKISSIFEKEEVKEEIPELGDLEELAKKFSG